MDNRPLATQYYGCWVVDFDHQERKHQGLDNALDAGAPAIGVEGPIHRHARLGGRLKYHGRAA